MLKRTPKSPIACLLLLPLRSVCMSFRRLRLAMAHRLCLIILDRLDRFGKRGAAANVTANTGNDGQ